MRWLALGLIVGACGHRTPTTAKLPAKEHAEPAPLVGYHAAFALTWRGARIGSATEELSRLPGDDDGLRFVRREHMVVRRGDALVPLKTTITIATDAALTARDVSVTRISGADETRGSARRDADGSWRVWFGDEPPRRINGSAVPAELLGMLVAMKPARTWKGTAFLPGWGFAVANVDVAPDSNTPGSVVATVHTPLGDLASEIALADDGTVNEVDGADGMGARRVDRAQLEAPFDPPELVDGTTIPLTGSLPDRGEVAIAIDGIGRPAPPSLPGQELVIETPTSWHMVLGAGSSGPKPPPVTEVPQRYRELAAQIIGAPGSTLGEVAALAAATPSLIDGDLSAPGTTADAALALGRGDCTAHAILFATLAAARGIPTRLVTGFRIDGDHMVRHRWVIAWLGDRWMAVDPTFGEAPAQPRLIGLAVHGASAAELAVVDTVAFAGLHDAHARLLPWR